MRTAQDLLKDRNHPVWRLFTFWLKGRPATKRKAREFLSLHPQYRR